MIQKNSFMGTADSNEGIRDQYSGKPFISVFKLIAGIVAHSGAMISDAIHSASDVGSTFIVIIGVPVFLQRNRTKSTSTDMKEWSVFLPLSLQECCLSLVFGIGITGAR